MASRRAEGCATARVVAESSRSHSGTTWGIKSSAYHRQSGGEDSPNPARFLVNRLLAPCQIQFVPLRAPHSTARTAMPIRPSVASLRPDPRCPPPPHVYGWLVRAFAANRGGRALNGV